MDDIAIAYADHPRKRARTMALAKLRLKDRVLGGSSLAAALAAMPLARTEHGPEAAATLAVAAIALLAGHRWAVGLIGLATILLAAALAQRWPLCVTPLQQAFCFTSALCLLPGLAALRRSAAALVVMAPVRRTPRSCRWAFRLLASGMIIPLISACARW